MMFDNQGESDEGPEMPEELRKLLQSITSKTLDTGLAHDVAAEEIMPTATQLAIEYGDLAYVYEVDGEPDLTIGEVIDPEQHAEEFPDWETRRDKYFALGRWYTPANPRGEGVLGWIPRSKLMKIQPWRYIEVLAWLEEGKSREPTPGWLYTAVCDAIAEAEELNPEKLFRPVACSNCGSHGIVVTISRTTTCGLRMGYDSQNKVVDGVTVLYETGAPEREVTESSAHSRCVVCGHSEELSIDDYRLMRKSETTVESIVGMLRL